MSVAQVFFYHRDTEGTAQSLAPSLCPLRVLRASAVNLPPLAVAPPAKPFAVFLLLFLFVTVSFAQDYHAPASGPAAGGELVIEGEYDGDVFGLNRTVRVRGRVSHGVIAFGGDVLIEGRVEGDVATVGGSIFQMEGSYVGGDVITLGGTYHHGKTAPGRNPASKTIMFAGYEAELRELARDPSVLLMPSFSLAFLGLRLLGVLLWFVVSLGLTAISPGAVSRAAARLQLTSTRVAVIGLLGAFVAGPGLFAALHYLPPVLGVLLGATVLLLLLLAYVFGRVCIYAATGRWLQRLLLSEEKRSESVALLFGAVFWSVMLTLPYAWPFVFTGLLVVSLGLSLTARHPLGRKRAAAA